MPVFPLVLFSLLEYRGNQHADAVFIAYSASVVFSAISDFGIRFHLYKKDKNKRLSTLLKVKLGFSVFSVALLNTYLYFVYSYPLTIVMILSLACPFYAMSDVYCHYLKSIGEQKNLLTFMVKSWALSIILPLPFLFLDLAIYVSSVILLSNFLRFYFARKYVGSKVSREELSRCEMSSVFSFFDGFLVFLTSLRAKLPFLIIPLIYPGYEMIAIGIAVSIIFKVSELGISYFEQKHVHPENDGGQVYVFFGLMFVIISTSIFLIDFFIINGASFLTLLLMFLLSVTLFGNQYMRMVLVSHSQSGQALLACAIGLASMLFVICFYTTDYLVLMSFVLGEVSILIFYLVKRKRNEIL